MGIAITAVGNGYPSSEFAVQRGPGHARQADAQAAEAGSSGVKTVDIDATAADLQKIILAFNRKLRFEVNRDLNEVIVKVVDSNTDKVIKEIPPEELQRLHLKIKEMIGLLFDERA